MKQPIITISGPPGSGKSTIAKNVAAELNYEHHSSGDFMRTMARKRGITLAELSKQAETDPSIDKKIDAYSKTFRGGEAIVIDSRLAFHFLPESFSVFLDVTAEEAARRIHEDEKESRSEVGEDHDTLAETAQQMQDRIESERARYTSLYGIDHLDPKQYDVVIDTTNKDIAAITEAVITAYNDWRKK